MADVGLRVNQACAAMATKVVTAAGHLRATAHLLERYGAHHLSYAVTFRAD
jgi:hypothetical protein